MSRVLEHMDGFRGAVEPETTKPQLDPERDAHVIAALAAGREHPVARQRGARVRRRPGTRSRTAEREAQLAVREEMEHCCTPPPPPHVISIALQEVVADVDLSLEIPAIDGRGMTGGRNG